MNKKKLIIAISVAVIVALILAIIMIIVGKNNQKPEELLEKYFSYIEQRDYEEMCNMVILPEGYSKEDYIARNKKIYEGIEAKDINIEIETAEKEDKNIKVKYKNQMNTSAGNIEFMNTAKVIKDENKEYKIEWSSNLIFAELNNDYKVKVETVEGIRGSLLDRNGKVLATQGEVSRVGIVPGKLGENKKENIEKISQLLDVPTDVINKTLSSSWVKDDSFVPIKTISYDENKLKDKLLDISGVMIDSVIDRVYPYKEVTSHITGYVQEINAEEIEKLKEQGYRSNDIIGKDGLEKAYESRLKGTDGAKIYIVNPNGQTVKTIAEKKERNGEDIKLTIDINLQQKLYNQMKDDKGFFVAMNPKTGEILALVSTPSYDANKFVLGMTNDEWSDLNNNEAKPLYTRFLKSWCPGSTFKPITGAIGLTSGKLTTTEEFNYTGLAWQKDSSWGEHKVTTLKAYNQKKNLRNALIYSDNIYFAQAALKIGEETFTQGLKNIKFNENIEFDLPLYKSQYSNSDSISRESILADSGYGQGEILVNPIHMASIYSAFANEGNMIKPYLEYKEEKNVEYLVENAFSKEAANTIKEAMIQVVENPNGTGHDAKVEGTTIAGKTGTAELKKSKETEGEILGWFNCFTTDKDDKNSLLIISMAENKQSSYLKGIVKKIF